MDIGPHQLNDEGDGRRTGNERIGSVPPLGVQPWKRRSNWLYSGRSSTTPWLVEKRVCQPVDCVDRVRNCLSVKRCTDDEKAVLVHRVALLGC